MDKEVKLTPEFENKYLSLDNEQIEFASNLCKNIIDELKKEDHERTILVPIQENSEFWEARKVVLDQVFRSLRNRISFEDIEGFQIKTTLVIDVKITKDCVWFILLEFVCEQAVLRGENKTAGKSRVKEYFFNKSPIKDNFPKENDKPIIALTSAKRNFKDGLSNLLSDANTLKNKTIRRAKIKERRLRVATKQSSEAIQIMGIIWWRKLLKSHVFRRIMKNILPRTFRDIREKEDIVCRIFSKLVYEEEGVTEDEYHQFLHLSDEVPYLDLKERWFDIAISLKGIGSTA